jgi:hypothetical protein
MPGSLAGDLMRARFKSPEGMYGIFAKFDVYLTGPPRQKGHSSAISRLENRFSQVVEPLTYPEFITGIRAVLQTAGMKHVLTMSRGDTTMHIAGNEEHDDWDKSFEAALTGAINESERNELWILVSGWNDDFKFRQEVTFKEKHNLASPSISLVIRALPEEWAFQPGEALSSWMQRLRQTLHDKGAVEAEETRVRPKIERYLSDYQQLLKGAFSIRDLKQTLRINLSGIDLISLGQNYSLDYPS